MNPSARGWINKQTILFDKKKIQPVSNYEFYKQLKASGFIYGSNIHVANGFIINNDYTLQERCKINLLQAFVNVHKNSNSPDNLISSIISFYKQIEEHKTNFFSEIIFQEEDAYALEKIIHKRIQIDSNTLTKNFKYFITNALLYVDILAYLHFLSSPETTIEYIKQLETSIETVVFHALSVKNEKSKYDESLIKLLDLSMRFQNHDFKSYSEIISFKHNRLEALYLLDIACMATWSDTEIDHKEQNFLNKLSRDLNLKSSDLLESVSALNNFYKNNKENIALLSSNNIVKNFYDNSSKMVVKLISRNSKRLIKELQESKELLNLISQAAVRDLSAEEYEKINKQLLDIIKSIPSLAIFMLPGGAILLPLFIKFIPKLLPSAFDDNRIEKS